MKIFYITLTISICLIVGGFLCPPIGVIDGSVLTAVGELLMFPLIIQLPEAIKAGRTIKIKKDDLSLELSGKEEGQGTQSNKKW